MLLWWLAAEALGLIAFPILFLTLRSLPDRGWGISKAIGLILFGYVIWLLVSMHVLEYTRATVWLTFITLAMISAMIAWR